MAHDLIHIVFIDLNYCADWSKSLSSTVCIGRTEWGMVPRCGAEKKVPPLGDLAQKRNAPDSV